MKRGDIMFLKDTNEKVEILSDEGQVVEQYYPNEKLKTTTRKIMVKILSGNHVGYTFETNIENLKYN
ncbi:hypothetical protein AA14362_1916 [Acetobacter cerevisiae DSM 14362]|nr:hypothetical protein AA14362_1916 [Acetobacter cerevisiae DSM 14362]